MSKSELTPFLKWGSFKSHDSSNPDVLELQVLEVDTFETAYSVNVRVLQKVSGEWNEAILPLKNHESKNNGLQKEWEKWTRKKSVKVGMTFLLKTWLDTSKNGRPIRRFVLDF